MSWLYTIVFAGLVFSSNSAETPLVSELDEACPAVVEQVVEQVADETERFEKSYPLNANGRVKVSNINGSIVVEAWDRNEVKFEYTKIADSKERLAEVDVEIDARPEYFRAEANYDNWKSSNGERWRNGGRLNVEFKLWVPRGATLNEIETVNGSVTVSNFTNTTRASAVNGSVTATNIRGTAKLSTVNGAVKADFDRLESGSRIALETVNGTVNLMLPSDANATVRAESLNGNITNTFGLPVRKGKYVGRDLYGKLGSGEVQIKLESVNGGLSIDRKNDGKQPGPAVDLLPKKAADDEDWDFESNDLKTVNKTVTKAIKDSAKASANVTTAMTANAIADAAVELKRLEPELAKINTEAMRAVSEEMRKAAETMRVEDLRALTRDAKNLKNDSLVRLSEATFFPTVPRVEKKSDSFNVKGVPKVSVLAKGCSVAVKAWDKAEVQYRVVQFSDPRTRQAIDVKDQHTDSSVRIEVVNPAWEPREGNFRDSRRVHVEVYVPRRADLKIEANGEIRLEGVSGDLQVIGADENIDVRDSEGKLNVRNDDGQVRIVGFKGELITKTADGDIRLDGDFSSINAEANDGTFVLTVPVDLDAEIIGAGEEDFVLRFADIENGKRVSSSHWKFGNGARKYRFAASGGDLTIQNRDLIIAENR